MTKGTVAVEKKPRKPRVTHKPGEFIKLWNSSKDVPNAVEKTGMSYCGAVGYARRLAAGGACLKKLLICSETVPA